MNQDLTFNFKGTYLLGMEVIEKRKQLLDILESIESELNKNPESIPDHVFRTLEEFCKLYYTWKHSNEKNGWSKKLGYFTPEEVNVVEGRFRDFDQVGGASEDAEFTKSFGEFQNILSGLGTQIKEITSSLGIITMNTIKKVLPKDLPSLEDARKNPEAQDQVGDILFSLIGAIVEGLRIWVAMSPMDSSTFRVLLSFSQMILDTVRGNTRQAIISSIGLFGKHGFYISILGRFMINIIEFISPNIRSKMEFDIYKNLKTLSAGILLWFYYMFAPQTLKYNINEIFEEIRKIAQREEISLGPLKDEINKQAKEKNIILPKLPLEDIPSYDDLQIFGTLLKQPDVACQSSFQKLIQPLRSIFTLRATLDLLDIPTGQVELNELCARKGTNTRKNTGQTGGKRRKQTRRVKNE